MSPQPRAWEEKTDIGVHAPYDERYYGISYKARGHILFLDAKVHSEFTYLTSYSHNNIIYAYHAWYSSRASNLSIDDLVDGVPVSLLFDIRKEAFEYMKQIHQSSACNTK